MIRATWQRDGIVLYRGDCLCVLPQLDADSVDAIVTDPPYGIGFMGRAWDTFNLANHRRQSGTGMNRNVSASMNAGCYDRSLSGSRRFYDWSAILAEMLLRLAKPGAHLLAFAGTRTFHRLTCALEDAGWEIRDCLMWIYGQGFPKSLDVSKAIDKAAGVERKVTGRKVFADGTKAHAERSGGNGGWQKPWMQDESSRDRVTGVTCPATEAARQWEGFGTALKPAWEPIILARKPLDGTVAENVQKWGCGALNIDGCRIDGPTFHDAWTKKNGANGSGFKSGKFMGKMGKGSPTRINEVTTGNTLGRWPENLVHDGSEEVVGMFPDQSSGALRAEFQQGAFGQYGIYGKGQRKQGRDYAASSGSAARFFYCAKASRADREEGLDGFSKEMLRWSSGDQSPGTFQSEGTDKTARNHHPTVKPTDLMRWLCRLVTPPGGIVLDPLMGSGSTGKAAIREGFRFVGVEREADYFKIARARIKAALPARKRNCA